MCFFFICIDQVDISHIIRHALGHVLEGFDQIGSPRVALDVRRMIKICSRNTMWSKATYINSQKQNHLKGHLHS